MTLLNLKNFFKKNLDETNGISLDSLIIKATTPSFPEQQLFAKILLLTYLFYSTPKIILYKLRKRIELSKHDTSQLSISISLLQDFIRENYNEIKSDLLSETLHYVSEYNKTNEPKIDLSFNQSNRNISNFQPPNLINIDKSIFWKDFKLMDLNPEELAKQLTLWAAKRCDRITKSDIYQYAEEKKSK